VSDSTNDNDFRTPKYADEISSLKSLLAQETGCNDELARKLQEREKELIKYKECLSDSIHKIDMDAAIFDIHNLEHRLATATARIETLEGALKAELRKDCDDYKIECDSMFGSICNNHARNKRIETILAAHPEAGDKEKTNG